MEWALAVAAILAVAVVVFVARPFLREERDRALAALKELEFDHRTGKVSDEDYRAQVGPLRRRAAEVLRALEGGEQPRHERISDPGQPVP